mmetsp:Transcript_4256/g.16053  ORF Transcript_4256/g.16053 Transcript_4256/m.16053 type:complete len:407 (-) Transcript_4256:178-1398(-)|eukprot:CAMPEP_0117440822 /NCGR_PEP_ID=MMETSP0759-20121206/3295_1 /TAXON_ID=63605 /ORGANISM="Percolomonas cosmopolitus, Strain WS" /LENGTH=406 /DNA_ID=CAMNT_0005232613 /DNA_START=114 /DNA_END=1334 /DNA_ORIENTATION=-
MPLSEKQKILPEEKAPFTLGDIRKAIPSHCFKRDLVRSFRLLFIDLLCVAVALLLVNLLDDVLIAAFNNVEASFSVTYLAYATLRVALWTAYTVYQGITMTGLWVIAHECGHESFVEQKWLNDTLGYIVHTCLMVPYFSWQKSHSLHHHYTNNIQKDQVWVPELWDAGKGPHNRKPAWLNFIELIAMSVIGWPLYITLNVTSSKTKNFVSHFWAGSEIFNAKEVLKVNVSGLGMALWIFAVYRMCQAWGYGYMLRVYFAPLIVVFFFLTSITFLQHTDETVPHYNDEEWTWLRGALCTVDRPMSKWMDEKLHNIHSHHVVHHLFSKLPSYHAAEATEALKQVCGEYYLEDDTNFFLALWNNYRDCVSLTPEKDNGNVLWWKDLAANGRSKRDGVEEQQELESKKDQ